MLPSMLESQCDIKKKINNNNKKKTTQQQTPSQNLKKDF